MITPQGYYFLLATVFAFLFGNLCAQDTDDELSIAVSEVKSSVEDAMRKWASIEALTFTTHHEMRWLPDFLEYRKKSGSPMKIKHPTSSGEAEFTEDRTRFLFDITTKWGNGTRMRDEAGAWNGNLWQWLNRYPDRGHDLTFSDERDIQFENLGYLNSPLHYAFQFMSFPLKGDASNSVGIAELVQEGNWLETIRRAEREVALETIDGILYHVLTFKARKSSTYPTEPTQYKVWFVEGDYFFPKRVLAVNKREGLVCNEFLVSSFAEVKGMKFPVGYEYRVYDCMSDFGNNPYSITEYEVVDAEVNPRLAEDYFTLDLSTVRRVIDKSTGDTGYIEK